MSTTLDKKVDKLDKKVDKLVVAVDKLTSSMGIVKGEVNTIKRDFVSKKDLDETIENLAIMIKNNFDQMVTKEHFDSVIMSMDRRFDIIEDVSIAGHDRRIEILEDKVGIINTKLKISRNK